MRASLKAGCNFWNAGEFYGTPELNSLTLLEKYFTKYPEDADKIVLSIKGGLGPNLAPDGSPGGVRRSIDNCLKLLKGKKSIDIFECARVDPKTPIETSLRAMEEYVKTGKIGGIALSEVSASTIERAAKVTKISAVEVEFSLWATAPLTNGIMASCAKHNIPLVAYSPIGRGMLTGQVKSFDDIPEDDFRRTMPRFQPGNFEINLKLVKELEKIANQKRCTSAQLAIAWVRSLSEKDGNPVIVPIPGATTEERIAENSKEIALSEQELSQIDSILKSFGVIGDRYGGPGAALMDG